VAEPPGLMVAGESAVGCRENDGVAVLTIRVAFIVPAKVSDVPVTVKSKLPVGMDEVVFTVKAALACWAPAGTETDAGEQEAP
jgi:hypothetical protein